VGAGDVVFAAGTYVADPQRPAVRGGDDLDVAAVVFMLSGPSRVGAVGAATLSVAMRMPSRLTWVRPAFVAAFRAWCRSAAWAVRASS
jgi:hypothetical protein